MVPKGTRGGPLMCHPVVARVAAQVCGNGGGRTAEEPPSIVRCSITAIVDGVRGRADRGSWTLASLASRPFHSRHPGAPQAVPKSQTLGLSRPGLMCQADGEALDALGFPKDTGFSQRTSRRKACRSCLRFVRLADLLTADALLDPAHDSIRKVADRTLTTQAVASVAATAWWLLARVQRASSPTLKLVFRAGAQVSLGRNVATTWTVCSRRRTCHSCASKGQDVTD